MKTSVKIKLDTYNCVVNFIVTDRMSQTLKGIYKKYKIQEDVDGEAEGLVVTIDISNYYLLIDGSFLTHNTIAHEVFHVAVKMSESREIYDEESQAWIAGYIASGIYKFLDKKSLKVSHE